MIYFPPRGIYTFYPFSLTDSNLIIKKKKACKNKKFDSQPISALTLEGLQTPVHQRQRELLLAFIPSCYKRLTAGAVLPPCELNSAPDSSPAVQAHKIQASFHYCGDVFTVTRLITSLNAQLCYSSDLDHHRRLKNCS